MRKIITILFVLAVLFTVPKENVSAAFLENEDIYVTLNGLEYGSNTDDVTFGKFPSYASYELSFMDFEGNKVNNFSYVGPYSVELKVTSNDPGNIKFENDGNGAYNADFYVNQTVVPYCYLVDENGKITESRSGYMEVHFVVYVGNKNGTEIDSIVFNKVSEMIYFDGSIRGLVGDTTIEESDMFNVVSIEPYYFKDGKNVTSQINVVLRANEGYSFEKDNVINTDIIYSGLPYDKSRISGIKYDYNATILDETSILFNSYKFDEETELEPNDLLITIESGLRQQNKYKEIITLNLNEKIRLGTMVSKLSVDGYDTSLMDAHVFVEQYDETCEEYVMTDVITSVKPLRLVVILSMKDSINNHFDIDYDMMEGSNGRYYYSAYTSIDNYESLLCSTMVGEWDPEYGLGMVTGETYGRDLKITFEVEAIPEDCSLYYNPSDSKLYTDSGFKYEYELKSDNWSGNGNTLTLNDFAFYSDKDYSLYMPKNSTIKLIGDNYIGNACKNGFAIRTSGKLTIEGPGTLTIMQSGRFGYGIGTDGLEINDTVIRTFGTTDFESVMAVDDIYVNNSELYFDSYTCMVTRKNIVFSDSYVVFNASYQAFRNVAKIKLNNTEAYFLEKGDSIKNGDIGSLEIDGNSYIGNSDNEYVYLELEKGSENYTEGNTRGLGWHIEMFDLADYDADSNTSNGYEGISAYIDDIKLTENKDYTLSDGSVRISFNKNLLNSLGVGKHDFTVVIGRYSLSKTVTVNRFVDTSCEAVIGPEWTWDNVREVCKLKVVNTKTE